MTPEPRHRVTRGYVGMLIFAVVTVAVALTVAGWGLLALGISADPVSTAGRPRWGGPLAIVLALVLLAWTLWRQALAILRGRRAPAWGYWALAGGGAYVLWSLVGSLLGLPSSETWGSPFALILVPIWVVASLGFWALLVRRVFTDRGRPRWPWERDDDLGPDWVNYGLDPWHEGPAGSAGDPLGGERPERPDSSTDGSEGETGPGDGRG